MKDWEFTLNMGEIEVSPLEEKVMDVYHCPKTDFYWITKGEEINIIQDYEGESEEKPIPSMKGRKFVKYEDL